MAWAVIDSFSPNAAGGKYLTPEYIDAYYKLQDLARKPAERYRREQKKMSFPHRSGDERSQLWEPCERCGNEPSYATFHGHLCEKCMKKVGMRVSMADSANRIAVAKELVKLARELVAIEFDTDAEKKKYQQEHDVRPGTKLTVKQEEKSPAVSAPAQPQKTEKKFKPSPEDPDANHINFLRTMYHIPRSDTDKLGIWRSKDLASWEHHVRNRELAKKDGLTDFAEQHDRGARHYISYPDDHMKKLMDKIESQIPKNVSESGHY
jgi:hypothetical protein